MTGHNTVVLAIIAIGILILQSTTGQSPPKSTLRDAEIPKEVFGETCGSPDLLWSNHQAIKKIEHISWPDTDAGMPKSDICQRIFQDTRGTIFNRMKFLSIDLDPDKIFPELRKDLCRKRCVASLPYMRLVDCGPKRKPLMWSRTAPTNEDMVPKVNCTNLDFPVSPERLKTLEFYMKVSFGSANYAQSKNIEFTMQDYTPLFNYLSGLNVFAIDYFYESRDLVKIREQIPQFFKALGPTVRMAGYMVFQPYWSAIKNLDPHEVVGFMRDYLTNVESFSFHMTALLTSLPQPVSDLGRLKMLEVMSLMDLKTFPAWMGETRNLVVLRLDMLVALEGDGGFSALSNNWPKLKFLDANSFYIGSINGTFMKRSTELAVLLLHCTRIRYIAPGAFDHMTKLKYLDIGSNLLSTLDPDVTSKLNLIHFDLSLSNMNRRRVGLQTHLTRFQVRENDFKRECVWIRSSQKDQAEIDEMLNLAKGLVVTAEHLTGSKSLQGLEIGGLSSKNIDFKSLLANRKDLRWFNAATTSLKGLDQLPDDIKNMCDLFGMNLDGNDLSNPNWLPASMASVLSNRLGRLTIRGTNMSVVPPALYILLKKNSMLHFFAEEALLRGSTEYGLSPLTNCEAMIWFAIMNGYNNPFMMNNQTCLREFENKKAEIIRLTKLEDTSPEFKSRCASSAGCLWGSVARGPLFGLMFTLPFLVTAITR